MSIEIQKPVLKGTATNDIKGFNITYEFEHAEGTKPTSVRARGTVEGELTVIDVTKYDENIQMTVHYPTATTDLTVIVDIIADIKQIIDSI